jgi:hypothetical protein
VPDGVEMEFDDRIVEQLTLHGEERTHSRSLSVTLRRKLLSRRKRFSFYWLVSRGLIFFRTGKMGCRSSIFFIVVSSSSLLI